MEAVDPSWQAELTVPVRRYSRTARWLHWLVALAVIATVPAGLVMVGEDISRGLQDSLFIFHKNLGVIILILVAARLAWRVGHPAPPLPDSVPRLQRRVALATHWLLYAALLFMTITGYIRVTAGGFPLEMLDALGIPPLAPRSDPLAEAAKTAHFYGRFALIGMVALHVAAAAYHGLIRRDGVFGRIWPPLGR